MLQALSSAWVDRGDDVRATAGNVAEHLRREAALPSYTLTAERVDAAVGTLAAEFDPMAGGFGGSPKFPPTMVLEFLRRYDGPADLTTKARHMLARTTAAMAGSGMYDQVGGGFARYAVDRGWVVPHFEKMLYDNAQLVGLYARLGTEQGDRVAAESADFLLRELRHPRGRFRLGARRRQRRRGRRARGGGPVLRLDADPAGRGPRRPTTARGRRRSSA